MKFEKNGGKNRKLNEWYPQANIQHGEGKGMRVVVDTNVLISGIIKPNSRIASFYSYLKQRVFLLLYSSDSFEELAGVLFRLLRRGKYDLS